MDTERRQGHAARFEVATDGVAQCGEHTRGGVNDSVSCGTAAQDTQADVPRDGRGGPLGGAHRLKI